MPEKKKKSKRTGGKKKKKREDVAVDVSDDGAPAAALPRMSSSASGNSTGSKGSIVSLSEKNRRAGETARRMQAQCSFYFMGMFVCGATEGLIVLILYLRDDYTLAVGLIGSIVGFLFLLMLLFYCCVSGSWKSRHHYAFMNVLCLASIAGLIGGAVGGIYLQEYWWYKFGKSYKAVDSVATMPWDMSKPTLITFVKSTTVEQNYTGVTRVSGSLYCAAPLGPASGDVQRVLYWATDGGCCSLHGIEDCIEGVSCRDPQVGVTCQSYTQRTMGEVIRWPTAANTQAAAAAASWYFAGGQYGDSNALYLRMMTPAEHQSAQNRRYTDAIAALATAPPAWIILYMAALMFGSFLAVIFGARK